MDKTTDSPNSKNPERKNLINRIYDMKIKAFNNRYIIYNLDELLMEVNSGFGYFSQQKSRFEKIKQIYELNPIIDEREIAHKYFSEIKNTGAFIGKRNNFVSDLVGLMYGGESSPSKTVLKCLYFTNDILREAWYEAFNIKPEQTKLKNYVHALTDMSFNKNNLIFSSLWDPRRSVQKSLKHLNDNYTNEQSEEAVKNNLILANKAVDDLLIFAKKQNFTDGTIKALYLAGSLAGSQFNSNYGYSPKDDIDFLLISEETEQSARKPFSPYKGRGFAVESISYYLTNSLSKKYNVDFCTLGDTGGESSQTIWIFMTPQMIKSELESKVSGWTELAYIHLKFGGILKYENPHNFDADFRRGVINPYDNTAKEKMKQTLELIKK